MSLEGILIGLFAILIGAAFAFYGLKAFTILLPVWAFFVGLIAGAQLGQEIFGEAFFATVTSWVIGLVLGIVLAVLSYLFYYAAVVLIGASVGYTLGAGLLSALGLTGFLSVVAGIIVGVIVAIATFVLAVPIWLVILLTAIGGAAAIVNGVNILLGRIELGDISTGLGQGLYTDGIIGIVAWIVIAAAGFFYQTRSVGDAIAAIEREDYRY